MNERSGKRPSTDLAVKLSSSPDALGNVVLVTSSPSCWSCSSRLFAFVVDRGVDGDVVLGSSCVVTPPLSSRSASCESIHVERLTTSLSLRRSSWIEVSFWTWGCGFRSNPAKSAVSVYEPGKDN